MATLVRKARMTAGKVAANRANAARSTGPRTERGKRRSSLNSLRHGICARSFRESMLALGEDPREFDRLLRDFIVSFDPATPFETALVEDIAKLWWRKERAERAQAGTQVSDVEDFEGARLRELTEVNRIGIDEPQEQILEVGLRRLKDSNGKFEESAAFLRMLLAQVERGKEGADAGTVVRALYGKSPTWRGTLIVRLFEDLKAREEAAANGEAEDENGTSPRGQRAMLVNLLLEEIRDVTEEHENFLRRHVEISAAARDARLAPADSRWTWILRHENSLERQIDRKLKQLQKQQSLRRWGDRPWHHSRRGAAQDPMPANGNGASAGNAESREVEKPRDVNIAQTKPRSASKQTTVTAERSQNEPLSNRQRSGKTHERSRANVIPRPANGRNGKKSRFRRHRAAPTARDV